VSPQSGIPKHKLSRAVTLAGTGAKISGNYAKYYAKKVVGGVDDREGLSEANAKDTYNAFSSLKGGPLKVAQMLSIDKNFLPKAYREQFAKSYYSTPPLSYPLVLRTFKRTFGKSPQELFDTFTQDAVAAASIGQVHKASLNGKDYAVKIQYPGVAQSLKSDLGFLRPVAKHMLNMSPQALDRYMKEAEARLLEECDYSLELRRSMQLSQATEHLPDVQFPNYYPELSSSHIISMDWVEGLPLDAWIDSNPSQEERNRIGQALWDFLHFQVHELREFHADPHPGNFLVQDGTLFVLDFGCVKQISPEFHQAYFALLLPGLLDDELRLERCLQKLEILIDSDSPEETRVILKAVRYSLELLGRPYRSEHFDFSDPEYLAAIYQMGEDNRSDPELSNIDSSRGSADALYVNRAFFGLYNLLGRIGAKIQAEVPESVMPPS